MDAGRLLDGRRVIVVGGGGAGNGRGIARGMAAAGARVVVIDISPERAAESVPRSPTAAARPSRWSATFATRSRPSAWWPSR